MSNTLRPIALFSSVIALYLLVGFTQSWPLAITILNDALIVAIMALGLNIQWGYAGLFNVGAAGFFALGGLAVPLISKPIDPAAWDAGTPRILFGLVFGLAVIYGAIRLYKFMKPGRQRGVALLGTVLVGLILFRMVFDPAVEAVEAITPAATGNIGGAGLPVPLAWMAGGLFAAAAAWAIGKTALGLRSDYLAIATLGIGQIVIAFLKNEDWLDRGVKNITDISRWPVPHEIDLQQSDSFVAAAQSMGLTPQGASTMFVGLCFAAVLLLVLLVFLILAELSLNSPWGRMMRAIRDNEISATAMGKNVKARHLQVFVIGSGIIGVAGALYVSLHGLFAPASYDDPLRYTFLIWAMVILGGSGNNWGSMLGAFIIMLIWGEAENLGPSIVTTLTGFLDDGPLKQHLIDSAVQMRLPIVGLVLLLVLRFNPRGLLPEK